MKQRFFAGLTFFAVIALLVLLCACGSGLN